MPSGLQVFGPDGSVWMDSASKTYRRYSGPHTITANQSANPFPSLAGQGQPFAMLLTYSFQTNSVGAMTIDCPLIPLFEWRNGSGTVDPYGTNLHAFHPFASFNNITATVHVGAK